MHSTANAPHIGTVDSAPHGGTCLYVPRSEPDSAHLTYPETVSPRRSGECLWGYSYFSIFCSLFPSLKEGVSDRRRRR